jgi:ABC-type nitrate/sulfonate/bicarbonate transport system substrate-binding protein
MSLKRKKCYGIFLAASLAAVFLWLFVLRAPSVPSLRVGHGGGNLSAALYLASEEQGWKGNFETLRFGSTSDVGYALLSGGLDAGFVDIEKVRSLKKLPNFGKLTALGRITFPYGATLVLRKGLNPRLRELGNIRIAVTSPECVLLKAFQKDAERLKADLSNVVYVYMPFDTMIPALEAKEADAAVIKGAFAVTALRQGHSILYQDWEVKPGDECCPAIVDQAVQVLLARKEWAGKAEELVIRLLEAEEKGPEALRQAVARNTSIPLQMLEGQPVPEFNRADDSLVALLTEFLNEEGIRIPDDDDDKDDNDDKQEGRP